MRHPILLCLLTCLSSLFFYSAAEGSLTLPEFRSSQHQPVRVVATTSIIGDVVANIGGEFIQLTTLIPAGQDPHSYQATARDLAAVERADVIFVNGWDLEEGLMQDIEALRDYGIAPVAANIEPLMPTEEHHEEEGEHHDKSEHHDNDEHSDEDGDGDAHGHHHHGGADPHTWFSLEAVMQWSDNIAQVLSQLDPEHASNYQEHASNYRQQLSELQRDSLEHFANLADNDKYLVTNHDAFGYLARDYGLHVLGTVIPSFSTQAEPSARDLANLISTMREHDVCSIFTEVSGSAQLAQAVARELTNCDDVHIIGLYTGALGDADSEAATYLELYRTNVARIVTGLQQD